MIKVEDAKSKKDEMDQIKEIPEGYERILYTRCGDVEMLEIMRPAEKAIKTFPHHVSVSIPMDADGSLTAQDIAERLKSLLIDQMKG